MGGTALKRMNLTKKRNGLLLKQFLSAIQEWCITPLRDSTPTLLKQNQETSMYMSNHEIRHLLANAFLLNIQPEQQKENPNPKIGNLTLLHILLSPRGVERVCCFIQYFLQCRDEKETLVGFHRTHTIPSDSLGNLFQPVSKVSFLPYRMEDSKNVDAFVDFANKQIHIGLVTISHTQEEILFSCAPEAFVSLLYVETLESNEVLVIDNVRRYSDYKGYSHDFTFYGSWHESKRFPIIVMDATMGAVEDHFSLSGVLRDIQKAHVGFLTAKHLKNVQSQASRSVTKSVNIVTGNWGCGIFGGDPFLKFLQQVCAASWARVTLDFALFGDEKLAAQLSTLYEELLKRNIRGIDLLTFLTAKVRVKETFTSEFWTWIKQQ